MSFKTARSQIVKIVNSAQPTTSVAGSGTAFKYSDTSGDFRVSSTRHFYLTTEGGAVGGPLTSITRIYRADVNLIIFYQNVRSAEKFDEIVVSDYEVISNALLDVAGWQQASSKIRTITVAGSNIVRYEVSDTEDGRLLTINIELEYE
tara:strand:- start:3381 stop:3824 length:444 start_codon:yes stop_codon:yes gene_type:complete